MKRILILHISECGGHKKASFNIQEAMYSLDPDLEILNVNGFGHIYPWAEKFVDSIYYFVLRHCPKVWGRMYDKPKVASVLIPLSRIAHRIGFRKFANLIMSFNPDAIVATQAFPCGLSSDFKLHFELDIPLYAVVTDYHPHRFWIKNNVNHYFVACDDAKATLIEGGIDKEKIKTYGIPVSVQFLKTHQKQEVINEFGFKKDLPAILIMGGGLGYGPIKDIVKGLDKMQEQFQIITVCGRNKRLYKWFKRRARFFKKPMYYYGYVDFINKLMDFSDIIVTKAGGITVSEALAKKMAIIVIDPIPGQEERNVLYLEGKKALLKADTTSDINNMVKELVNDKDKLKSLQEKAQEHSNEDSSIKIAKLILDDK